MDQKFNIGDRVICVSLGGMIRIKHPFDGERGTVVSDATYPDFIAPDIPYPCFIVPGNINVKFDKLKNIYGVSKKHLIHDKLILNIKEWLKVKHLI